jgi:hypothetical protein
MKVYESLPAIYCKFLVAKLKGGALRRLEPSGAAGWVAVVLHGTPEVKARLSVRMSRRFARVPVEARAIPH